MLFKTTLLLSLVASAAVKQQPTRSFFKKRARKAHKLSQKKEPDLNQKIDLPLVKQNGGWIYNVFYQDTQCTTGNEVEAYFQFSINSSSVGPTGVCKNMGANIKFECNETMITQVYYDSDDTQCEGTPSFALTLSDLTNYEACDTTYGFKRVCSLESSVPEVAAGAKVVAMVTTYETPDDDDDADDDDDDGLDPTYACTSFPSTFIQGIYESYSGHCHNIGGGTDDFFDDDDDYVYSTKMDLCTDGQTIKDETYQALNCTGADSEEVLTGGCLDSQVWECV